MDIAVFGGAFDPPHIGHTSIAQYLLSSGKANQVWFLPVKMHAFGKNVTSPEHRLAMLEAATADCQDTCKINTYELSLTETNYTYASLQYFKQTYPEHTFSFVIGADNLAKFNEWDEYQRLLAEFKVWVYPREGFDFQPLLAGMEPLSAAPVVPAASTDIRRRVQAGESITGLVEPQVEQYIKTHHLYAQT